MGSSPRSGRPGNEQLANVSGQHWRILQPNRSSAQPRVSRCHRWISGVALLQPRGYQTTLQRTHPFRSKAPSETCCIPQLRAPGSSEARSSLFSRALPVPAKSRSCVRVCHHHNKLGARPATSDTRMYSTYTAKPHYLPLHSRGEYYRSYSCILVQGLAPGPQQQLGDPE